MINFISFPKPQPTSLSIQVRIFKSMKHKILTNVSRKNQSFHRIHLKKQQNFQGSNTKLYLSSEKSISSPKVYNFPVVQSVKPPLQIQEICMNSEARLFDFPSNSISNIKSIMPGNIEENWIKTRGGSGKRSQERVLVGLAWTPLP